MTSGQQRQHQSAFILADPQEITCWALQELIRREQPDGLVPEVCRTSEALKRAVTHVTDERERVVAVVDYTLMDLSEDELLILCQRHGALRFVLFCDQLSRDFLRRMVYGVAACSVLLKDDTLDTIASGLRCVAGGEQYVCPRVRAMMESGETSAPEERPCPLTPAERAILRALAMGQTTKEIAASRNLSVYTVTTHRKNIFRKLHVNNVQEAVRMAYRLGVADPMEYYI